LLFVVLFLHFIEMDSRSAAAEAGRRKVRRKGERRETTALMGEKTNRGIEGALSLLPLFAPSFVVSPPLLALKTRSSGGIRVSFIAAMRRYIH
jgi:hypothetical protein